MKRIVRLTESDLHRIVKESVNKLLKEGKPLPASKNEFKQDRDSLLQIKRHLESFLQGLDGYVPDEEPYEHALSACITNIDRAMEIMDKTLLFTTSNYSKIPIHWWAGNYDENGNIDYNYSGSDFD